MHLKRLVTTTTLYAALFAAPAAFAQPPQGQPPQGYDAPQQSLQPAQVDDATIDKFVEAQAGIQNIQVEISRELQGAEGDEEQTRALQTEAQQKMVGVVEEVGLTPEEYNKVAMLVSQDPQLRQQVIDKLQQR